MMKKLEFIKNSRDRLNNLKVNALKRQQAARAPTNYGNKAALRSSYSHTMPQGRSPKASDVRSGSVLSRNSSKGAREKEDLVIRHASVNFAREYPSTSTLHEGQ